MYCFSDLIARLDAVQLEQRPPRLAGKEIRALQLADDLALLARSPTDMQRLINEWERFCDEFHIETQIAKTKTVAFCRADDGDVAVGDDRFLQRSWGIFHSEWERRSVG